jgi:rhamnosyltransferase subunit B
MVIVPWSYDQPDNAERARKLGVSRTLARSRYNAERIGRELRVVLDDRQGYCRRAAAMGDRISAENGIASACDVIEPLAIRSATRPSGPLS